MKLNKSFLAASAIALGLGTAVTAHAFDGQQDTKGAKITQDKARQVALKTQLGANISDEELEHETGGGGLRYSFDVNVGQAEHEIVVDATTGAVLENRGESPNQE
ncbi:MAG: peptidase M4 [Proteobacteria bacterium]|nr:peptidase M4 [Pseudomonadota bacterium]